MRINFRLIEEQLENFILQLKSPLPAETGNHDSVVEETKKQLLLSIEKKKQFAQELPKEKKKNKFHGFNIMGDDDHTKLMYVFLKKIESLPERTIKHLQNAAIFAPSGVFRLEIPVDMGFLKDHEIEEILRPAIEKDIIKVQKPRKEEQEEADDPEQTNSNKKFDRSTKFSFVHDMIQKEFLDSITEPLFMSLQMLHLCLMRHPLFQLKEEDFDVKKFFCSEASLPSKEDDFISMISFIIFSIFPYLISFFHKEDDKEVKKVLEENFLSHKRVHFKSKEEYEKCRKFVLERKDEMDLKKITMFLFKDCLILKKIWALSKITKNLKRCERILSLFFLQQFGEYPNDSDEIILAREFPDKDIKFLTVIWMLLFARNEMLCSRFDTPRIPTLNLLRYSRNISDRWLEIECSSALIEQQLALGLYKEALEFGIQVFETRIPSSGIKREDFFSEERYDYWKDRLMKEYIHKQFNDSTDNARDWMESKLSKFTPQKKDCDEEYFAIRTFGFFFIF